MGSGDSWADMRCGRGLAIRRFLSASEKAIEGSNRQLSLDKHTEQAYEVHRARQVPHGLPVYHAADRLMIRP